ncbi:hypothetical protein PVAP13_4KG337300 [Panicum virgatum]|uniref:Uncharacterized protein n=1 Tax=Panicum virgatum TaxID=38727 RepID=A0A8T0TWH6_PANVG|nr:hypothetical protein PVAP13_4KG337300 [Panicum virgatum]
MEFFGQLWLVPDSSPCSPRVRGGGERSRDNLVWIEKSKWVSNSFTPKECFPVGDGDVWDKSPKRLNFAEKIWGKGEKKSFAQAMQSMASRGRWGRRPRSPERNWDEWHGGY